MSDILKCIELPGETFKSKLEMFKALKENKSLLLDSKKAIHKDCDSIIFTPSKNGESTKAISVSKGSIKAVINTTKYLDSHNDVHVNGIWSKSLKDQKGLIYYVVNHELKVGSVIAFPKDVRMSVEDVSWKDLGADFDGNTQALVFEVKTEDVKNKDAKDIIESKTEIQHSVRMQYVKLDLAINDSSDDFKEEKAVWDKHISDIANKGKAIEQSYFWAVEEARVFKEGSMVLAGSNDITPMVYSNKIEPDDSTHKDEPSDDTLKLNIYSFN